MHICIEVEDLETTKKSKSASVPSGTSDSSENLVEKWEIGFERLKALLGCYRFILPPYQQIFSVEQQADSPLQLPLPPMMCPPDEERTDLHELLQAFAKQLLLVAHHELALLQTLSATHSASTSGPLSATHSTPVADGQAASAGASGAQRKRHRGGKGEKKVSDHDPDLVKAPDPKSVKAHMTFFSTLEASLQELIEPKEKSAEATATARVSADSQLEEESAKSKSNSKREQEEFERAKLYSHELVGIIAKWGLHLQKLPTLFPS